MPTITLSATAESLLRALVGPGRVDVTPENQEAFREWTRAGIVVPISTFARGEESYYRFTEEGWDHRDEWLAPRP